VSSDRTAESLENKRRELELVLDRLTAEADEIATREG
jgi:hypothetical protein